MKVGEMILSTQEVFDYLCIDGDFFIKHLWQEFLLDEQSEYRRENYIASYYFCVQQFFCFKSSGNHALCVNNCPVIDFL